MSSGRHPAKQCIRSLPFSAFRLRLGVLRSSWAGQKDIAFSPLRLATRNLASTSSKSANKLGVSFEWAGRLAQDAPRNAPPLERDLYQVSLRSLRVLLGVGSIDLALPRRLDPHNLVLPGALGVLCCLAHHHALPTDEVLRPPPKLWVYHSCYCGRP